jgi:hypothetical protein
MKKSGSQKSKSPSQLIDARIKELASISTVLEMTNAWATEAIKRN